MDRTLLNETRETVCFVCVRCCRFARYRRTTLIGLFGYDTLLSEVRFTLAEKAGCRLASREWRDPYHATLCHCEVRELTDRECSLNWRAVWESVRRGKGVPSA